MFLKKAAKMSVSMSENKRMIWNLTAPTRWGQQILKKALKTGTLF